jgi:para-aminobenzoate synthetase component 1
MITSAKKSHIRSEKKPIEITFHGMEEAEYLQHFESLASHIQQGDIYEVNYCLNFKAKAIEIDPLSTYLRLNDQTQAPFSVFHRDEEHFLLCGSPERYLKKEGNSILSQPIKGTIRRGDTIEEDELLKEKLANDPKEQAENVMIVDLVRNDLSRIATKASVKVDELFGVYSFKTVHQLISSISCKVDPKTHPIDCIKATFPMGSMTGAPKISAMKLIEAHEDFKRGIYSGAFGYFKPNGDFDLNVVIRSILYNSKKQMVSFPVGGALTSLANANDEYHECILKAKAMKKALQDS